MVFSSIKYGSLETYFESTIFKNILLSACLPESVEALTKNPNFMPVINSILRKLLTILAIFL